MTTKKRVLSLLLVLVLVVFSVFAVSCNKDKGNNTDDTNEPTENTPTKTSWPEAGVYYFDFANLENTLTLNVGDTFSLYFKGTLHSGKYTLTDESLELDFNAEGRENVTATYEGNVITLTFEGETMRLLKKLNYTVTFNVNGGSEVAAQTVINGKTAAKPQDPTRPGYVFVGWYADSAFTTPYAFGSAPVNADTTVYARWSAINESGKEFTVKLDANYAGAEALNSVQTQGGKLFDLPTLERDGYTFGGWWFSASTNGDMLSYKYEEGMSINANTTLYALWVENASGSKLAAPVVNVTSGTISWNVIDGARSYDVKVIGPDGEVILDKTEPSTTVNVSFSSMAAGKYEIRVTALATSGDENNSQTVRYYVNKQLNTVSSFTVVDSVLVFGGVENAEKYLITVVCGNSEHNHTNFDNGNSTYFSFAGCSMTAAGIKFTVTAVAEGYASSTSEVFTYLRVLDSVSGFRFDAATETLYWNEVASAQCYMVSVACGNADHNHDFVNFGGQTFVSLKNCAAKEGGIVVKVYPKTEGYLSPAATEYVYNKTTLETPANLTLSGNVLSWNAVAGATKYEVSVNGTAYETADASFDLSSAIDVTEGVDYALTVRALGDSASLATDVLVARYYEMNEKVTYANGKLTWAPVIGAQYYELQVNDGELVKVEGGVYSASVTLNKAGANVVKVRFVDGKTVSEWATTTVTAHRVTFDTLGGNKLADQFLAVGDPISLPEAEKPGYTFVAWYNVPGGASSNGAVYNDQFFAESGAIVLYAYYKANTYEVSFNYGVGGSASATTGVVTFDGHYELVVPTASDVAGAFGGWFSAPYGMGTQYTDESGKSLEPWTLLEGKELYAFWVDEALSFSLTKVNGKDVYSVSKGSRISLVSEVTIPATYRGLPVAFVAANAFENCTNLKAINLPETIEQISIISPFSGCSSLEAINVYDVEGVADPVFTSVDGVLLQLTSTGSTKLTLVPMAKTGTFRIPAGVTEIPEAAFANSSVSKVVITPEVTMIGREAFRDATKLTSVVFEVAADGSSTPLTIGTRAFMNCTSLAKITLPARLTEIKLQRYTLDGTTVNVTNGDNAFAGCLALESINVAANNQTYQSINNVLFSKDGRTLLLAPSSISGSYTIPEGTRNVAAGAFVDCDSLTELVIPSTLTLVGECAFYGLDQLKTLTFVGTSYNDLSVGKYAFRNCKKLATVDLQTGSRLASLGEGAFMGCTSLEVFNVPTTMTKIGASAFADCTALEVINIAELAATSEKTLEFGENAFQNCSSLATVNLPAHVSKIPGVFAGCSSLTAVNIADGSQYFKSVDGVVYDFNMTELIFFPSGKSGEFEIPATVTTINNGVFQNVKNLTKLTIPNSVTLIGDDAFNGASITTVEFVGEAAGALVIGNNAFRSATLGTLVLPEHTVSLGDNAFYGAKVTALTLNQGLGTIGAYAFYDANITVTVPASVKSIGDYAFSGYSNYPTPTLTVEGSQLETIGAYAFQKNKKIYSLTIPATVKSIGNYAFHYCYNISTVTFEANSQLETIGAYAFAENDFEEITIPGSVKTIGAYAFYYCYYLETVIFEEGTEDLVLGTTYVDYRYSEVMGTTYVDIYRGRVFYYCYNLENVQLPARLTTLEAGTFQYAGYYGDLNVTINDIENSRLTTIGDECFVSSSLVSFVIPKSVTNLAPYTDPVSGETYDRMGIGAKAFSGLYNSLTTITFELGGDLPLTLGNNAFDNAAKLTEVTLPARLTTYVSYTGEVIAPLANGAAVFNSCDSMTAFSVEDGGYYTALDGVLMTADLKEVVLYPMAREGSFTVPASVTKIHDKAFLEAAKLTEIVFEGGSEPLHIGAEAFKRCYGLVNVVLSDNVATLGTEVFYGCSALESLTLSKNLTNFLPYMVNSCGKLAEINVSSDGQGVYYSSVNGILYTADKSALVAYPVAKTDAEVVLDANVKSIYANAFVNNQSIVKVVLPEGLIEIQASAFDFCYNLAEINIPSTVQMIAKNAFRYCEALDTVTFAEGGDDLLIINEYAFAYTESLETLALPARLYSIGDQAFLRSALTYITFADNSSLVEIGERAFNESNIVDIELPAGVVKIGELAFYECTNLLSITFHEGLASIGDYAFAGCTELVSVRFPASLKTLGKSVFYYYEYGEYACPNLEYVTFAPNSQLQSIPAGTFAYTAIRNLTIPAGVKVIEGVESSSYKNPSAFYEAASLEAVYFENGSVCTEIGAYAFEYCENLQIIDLPATVSTIGAYAFRYCNALESITIPENAVNLGKGAFWGCDSLTDVELRTKATAFPDSFFYGCSSLANVTIPAAVSSLGSSCFGGTALEAFKVDPRNTYFKAIDGVLYTADGTGIVMIPSNKEIGEFVVPNTVTSINDKLFYDCQSITSLVFEGGRTEYLTIGRMAFAECPNLQKVIFTDKISYIDEEAFYYCTSLMYVEVASDMTEDMFGYDCFYNCSILEVKNLSSMELEAGDYYMCEGLVRNALRVFTEGESAISVVDGFTLMNADGEVYLISYNGTATEVVVPEGVTAIYEGAFSSVETVEKVTLSSTVKEIMSQAFYYSPVKTVVANEGLEKIGYEAFYYSDLESINLPSTLLEIGQSAFYGAELGGSIAIPESVVSIGSQAFRGNNDLMFLVTAGSRPDGWHEKWARYDYYDDYTVLWGFTGEDITYTFMNGEEVFTTIVNGTPIDLPAGPSVEGMVFMGWFDNAEFTGDALSGSYYNGEKNTLYAKFITEAEFEELNRGKTMDLPVIVESGKLYDVTIDVAKGQNYYMVTVEAGETWNITTSGSGDHKLFFYNESQTQIKSYDSGYAENYNYTFTEAGTYYIGVGYYGSSTTGSFQVTITKQ